MKIYTYGERQQMLNVLQERNESISGETLEKVAAILEDVKKDGDMALRKYSRLFDRVDIEEFLISEEEKAEIVKRVEPSLKKAIDEAAGNIRRFHERQKQYSRMDDSASNRGIMGQRVLPLKKVGLYVPGGTAAYPSSVLMSAIPAKVAGVGEIVRGTPPKSKDKLNPAVFYAAEVAGVKKIYGVGGAQAIAALAYGTKSIPRVDKIVGPGNIYVSAAKRLVYGRVDIDMIAGPSEILIIADETANPRFVAADLLSQAEHDLVAASILVTTDASLPEKVLAEIERQLKTLGRSEIIRESFQNFGSIVLSGSLDEAVSLSNEVAPEHLELCVASPFELLKKVENAGSVFLGHYTPRAAGRLFCRAQPCAPHQRHGPVWPALIGGQFCQEILFPVLFEGRAARGGG